MTLSMVCLTSKTQETRFTLVQARTPYVQPGVCWVVFLGLIAQAVCGRGIQTKEEEAKGPELRWLWSMVRRPELFDGGQGLVIVSGKELESEN
jgi:hypothetical protein